MISKKFSVLIIALSLVSCAFHSQPYVAYEGNVELSETSIFSSYDELSNNAHAELARIHFVDGQGTSCAQAGCPMWVRVEPGDHTFVIRYQTDLSWSQYSSGSKSAEIEVKVKDMKPQHVYVVRFFRESTNVHYRVEDLGQNPDYGIELGLKGVNQKYHPAKF